MDSLYLHVYFKMTVAISMEGNFISVNSWAFAAGPIHVYKNLKIYLSAFVMSCAVLIATVILKYI